MVKIAHFCGSGWLFINGNNFSKLVNVFPGEQEKWEEKGSSAQTIIFNSSSAFFLQQHTLAVHLSLEVALLSGLLLGKCLDATYYMY